MSPADLDELCPDWRERETFASGPSELLDGLIEHWENNADPDRLHFERFQPKIGGDSGDGEGGKVSFLESDTTVECDGGTPILEAGEEAGLNSVICVRARSPNPPNRMSGSASTPPKATSKSNSDRKETPCPLLWKARSLD
jgi:hypothetical protein